MPNHLVKNRNPRMYSCRVWTLSRLIESFLALRELTGTKMSSWSIEGVPGQAKPIINLNIECMQAKVPF